MTVRASWTQLSSKDGDIPEIGLNAFQTASLIMDVDLDNTNDFIITRRDTSPNILWYRRNTTGWSRYVIEKNIAYIEAGGSFHDIDRDGDQDIVFGGDWRNNKVWWWENPYPVYDPDTPWNRREIKSSGAYKHHDQIFGDFDGDGESELVFWNQNVNKLFLAKIPLNPKTTQPWPYTEIWSSGTHAEGLGKGDIDNDGKIDLLGGGRWFKHTGGTNYTPHLIDNSQRNSRIAFGDIKKGGNPEIVMVPGDEFGRLKWYECAGNPIDSNCWVGHDLLGFDVDHGHSLAVADINKDGNLDIFAAEMRLNGGNNDAKNWIFYGDGNGVFQTELISEGIGNHESKLEDLDGDSDVDILGKPFNWDTPRIDIWLNNHINLSLDMWDRQLIDPEKSWRSVFITSADMDNDGNKDIITGGWWYKNPGLQGNNWIRNTIGLTLNNMATVYDFDGDGDIDVLGTQGKGSETNSNFVWGKNDGSGNFTILNNIEPGVGNFLQGVAIGRFQNGGSLEIAISWHDETKGLQMLTVPANVTIDMWKWRMISTTSQGEDLSKGDIDNDGDLDLLLGTKWLRNDASTWNVFSIDTDTSEFADRNILADINSDGRLDAIVGFEGASLLKEVVWYEQSDSISTWTKHIITSAIGPMSLDVADIDNDGDMDVVVGEHNLAQPSKANLFIFENSDGKGMIWNKHVIYTGDEHHDGSKTVDIDNDGDLDVISIGWGHGKVILYKNNANLDYPVISTQPLNQEVMGGSTAIFSVVATGTAPLIYQWQKNDVNVVGATSATYITPTITLSDNGSTFSVKVTNSAGSIMSNTSTLTVLPSSSVNLINNPGFENGKTNWTFYTSATGNFTIISPGFEGNNSASLTLTSNGTNIQLYQKNVTLEPKGIYRLSFAAYSTTGHDVKLRLVQHGFPFTDYGLNQTFDLGTNWQTFTTEFTAANLTATVNDSRLIFYLTPFVEAGDIYYIDDVRLEKIGIDDTPPTIIGNTPTGTNVVANTPITVTFSEKMLQNAAQSALSTSPASNGSFYWEGTKMTYMPYLNLAYDTLYTVTVGTGTKDSAGNNLQSAYSWQFRTILLKPIIDCTTISSPGVYALNVDIMNHPGTCINITSSNVIFDGTGHKIDGTDAAGAYGVNVHNTSDIITNITVTNVAVTDWDNGIYFRNAMDGSISKTIENSNSIGIVLNNSNTNNVTDNNISNSNTAGIKVYSSGNNTIYNNYFNNIRNFVFDGIANKNIWNTTRRSGKNIIGGSYIGGNFWGNLSAGDFSQTCPDSNDDGLCDLGYTLNSNNIDFLPLTSKPAEKWISVVSPNGGENWRRGITQLIIWDPIDKLCAYVRIELLKPGLSSKVIIAATLNDGSLPWVIPPTQPPGDDYYIKITCTTNSTYTDTSDNPFTILTPSLTVVSPNGGENWRRGTTQTIKWNSTESPKSYVKIELLKPGVGNKLINASTLNDGSHPWLIPATQLSGDDYKIKITSTINASINDTSDNNFTIPAPSLTIVSPNGEENWRRGTTQTIKWNSTENPKSYVRIELLKPGAANKVIISSTLNDGSHPWLIPAAQLPGGNYKVKITSTINASINDTSDNPFTIPTPSITVVSPNGGENWTRGIIQTIRWNSTENPKSYVKIELLKPGMANKVILYSTLNDGSHPWPILAIQGTGDNYRIKITSTINASINDTSDNFSIVPPKITVTSPNGGQTWLRGTNHLITWNYTGNPGTYVKIELLKGGVLNRTILTSTLNDKSQGWTIPSTQIPGADYKIRITSTANLAYNDTIDSNFTIAFPII